MTYLQCEAPVDESVQLVQITPISLWFMVPITIVFMGFLNHRSITFGGLYDWSILKSFRDLGTCLYPCVHTIS